MVHSESTSYNDLTKFAQVVGSVRLRGMDLQLCDYVECLDNNIWYAAAHYDSDHGTNDAFVEKSGIKLKTLTGYGQDKKEFHIAYVPENLLKEAKPLYNDAKMTDKLIQRLKMRLSKLNAQNVPDRMAG